MTRYVSYCIYLTVCPTDLSRNRLLEVPAECTGYHSLERLLLYHNTIKSIPESITSLQSLQYLDIRYVQSQILFSLLLNF